jgi:phenylalanyl-tRNA synthetase alpha subunit
MRQFNTLNQLPFLDELSSHQQSAFAAQSVWEIIAPDNFASISKAVSIKNQQLNITTTHNAVAAKIKFLTPNLLQKLQLAEIEVNAIHVKVEVQSIPQQKQKPLRKVSKNAANKLNQLAKNIDGTPLADVLTKLASKADG